jgi:hypothetical protein
MSLDAVIALNKKPKVAPVKKVPKEERKPAGGREGGKAKFQKTREAPYVPKPRVRHTVLYYLLCYESRSYWLGGFSKVNSVDAAETLLMLQRLMLECSPSL